MSKSYKILVGSYTNSLVTLSFTPSPSPASLKIISTTLIGTNPTWVAKHPTIPGLAFATLETTEGKVVRLKYDGEEVEVGERVGSGGEDPAHFCVVGEGEVVAGNYTGSSILPISITPTHTLSPTPSQPPIKFTGTGPNSDRQEKSHPHQVYKHPTREELLVPDLGADKVWRLLRKEGEKGEWEVKGEIGFEAGSGPRHVVVHENILYTVLELTSHLSSHTLPPLSSPTPPKLLSTLPTTPTSPPASPSMLAAEILLSPSSPPKIYVSNRNDPSPSGDTITIFTPHPSHAKAGEIHTGLNHVRGMAFGGEEGKWLVVGGVNGGGVKVFERGDEEGLEWREVARCEVEKPTCFVWL